MAGLVPAIAIGEVRRQFIEITGTRPVMTMVRNHLPDSRLATG
jgi:hypothetical protein